jgi:hypothetical protein
MIGPGEKVLNLCGIRPAVTLRVQRQRGVAGLLYTKHRRPTKFGLAMRRAGGQVRFPKRRLFV